MANEVPQDPKQPDPLINVLSEVAVTLSSIADALWKIESHLNRTEPDRDRIGKDEPDELAKAHAFISGLGKLPDDEDDGAGYGVSNRMGM